MSQESKPSLYETFIAELRLKKEQAIRDISQKYDVAISALEALMGEGSLATFGGADMFVSEAEEISIKVGEFHGMPTTSAAKVILERSKKPLKTDEIVTYIEKSGRKLEAKNPAGNIYSSLKRNRDFELVAPNTWGLTEWYPGKRRTPAKSLAVRTEEIMGRGPTSLNDATKRAEEEAATEEEDLGRKL